MGCLLFLELLGELFVILGVKEKEHTLLAVVEDLLDGLLVELLVVLPLVVANPLENLFQNEFPLIGILVVASVGKHDESGVF